MSEALRQVVWKCDRCGGDAQAIFGIFPSCKCGSTSFKAAQPPAPTAQPAADDRLRMALRADLAIESLAVDDLLRAMGEDPEQYRTEGGAVNRLRLLAWLKDRAAQPVQQPSLTDWSTPTTLAQRMSDAVTLLCNGKRPPDDMLAGWLDAAADDHRLQDFAVEHGPAWAQGIGLLDAARVMADQPTEGVAHEVGQPAQQPGAEPFAHICVLPTKDAGPTKFFTAPSDPRGFPVYLAAPAQRQPLSDEQIDSLTFPFLTAELGPTAYDRAIARAIEAAHGITAAPAAQKGEKL